MIWILAGTIVVGLIFLWQMVLKPSPVISPVLPSPEISKMAKRVEINLEIFKNPAFQELKNFEELAFPKEKIGRQNPFQPY